MNPELKQLEEKLEHLKQKRDKEVKIMGFASRRITDKISKVRMLINNLNNKNGSS